jgi:amino acid transporter
LLTFFSSEAIILFIYICINGGAFDSGLAQMNDEIQIYVHVIIAISLNILFSVLNFISLKTVGKIQLTTTVLKFLPLIVAIVVGVVFFGSHNHTYDEKKVADAFSNTDFTFSGIIVALPAVLFAYDGFLSVAQVTSKVKGGEKKTA